MSANPSATGTSEGSVSGAHATSTSFASSSLSVSVRGTTTAGFSTFGAPSLSTSSIATASATANSGAFPPSSSATSSSSDALNETQCSGAVNATPSFVYSFLGALAAIAIVSAFFILYKRLSSSKNASILADPLAPHPDLPRARTDENTAMRERDEAIAVADSLRKNVAAAERARDDAMVESMHLRESAAALSVVHAANVTAAVAAATAEGERRAAALARELEETTQASAAAQRELTALSDTARSLEAAKAAADALRNEVASVRAAALDQAHAEMDVALAAARADAEKAVAAARAEQQQHQIAARAVEADCAQRVAAALSTGEAAVADAIAMRAFHGAELARLRSRIDEQETEIYRLRALLEAEAASKVAAEAELATVKRTALERRYKQERLPNFAGGGTVKLGGRTVVVVRGGPN